MKQEFICRCWKKSHLVQLDLHRSKHRSYIEKCGQLKIVCPQCKPENVKLEPLKAEGIFNVGKAYKCKEGHLNIVSAFGTGFINIQGPEKFENPNIHVEDLKGQRLACQHDGCGLHIEAVDDSIIEIPQANAIKTKTRIGDVWDKNRVEPVRTGSYNQDGVYSESITQQKNSDRLQRMKRNRNISESNLPGKILKKRKDLD